MYRNLFVFERIMVLCGGAGGSQANHVACHAKKIRRTEFIPGLEGLGRGGWHEQKTLFA